VEIHGAPGPPRTSIVLVGAQRIAVLEVGPGRESGAVHLANRTRWQVRRLPGASEWWLSDDAGDVFGTIVRTTLLRERFTLELGSDRLDVLPTSKPWRRHWSVLDAEGREIMELLQRPLSRTVHDLFTRSGDLPRELPLMVAWVAALATSDPLVQTRRPHSTTA
jgi:hypothetical protein